MISQTAEYALRAVVYLAMCTGSPTSRREIADAAKVPGDYLTKVMQVLDRAGIVVAQRGPGGGYKLAVAPDELSVLDVVSAISPIPRVVECPLGIEEHSQLCPLHKRLDEAAEFVEQAFQATTIAELVPQQPPGSNCQFPDAKQTSGRK